MYRLNLLPRKVLISTDEVVAQGFTDGTIDPRLLLSAIQIAEERFIKPAICKDFYYDFREKKNVLVTSINKAFLETQINEGNTSDHITIKEGDIINAIEFVDDPWYVLFWNEHLWKLCAECVLYIASPTNFSRFSSSGEIENNPRSIGDGQSSAAVDLGKFKYKMDKMLMDRIDPMIAAAQEWLSDNRGHFASYNCRNFYQKNTNGVSVDRKTAWVHGVYDTERRGCYRKERCDD